MLYLHSRYPPIIHRDIKSHNIFITEPSPGNFIAKIGDWGSARAVALGGSKTLTHGVGTACWLAPEVINYAHSSKHSDVFAFGIVLWEMYTRQEVYEGLSATQIIAKVAHDNLRPVVPRDCPWAGIMTECWKTVTTIKSCKYLNEHALRTPMSVLDFTQSWQPWENFTPGASLRGASRVALA